VKNKMVVKLVSFTPNPVGVMMYGFKNMLGIVPSDFETFLEKEHITPELVKDFMEYVAYEPLAGAMQEYVSTIWYFDGVSRAFQQQLTRHRTAAYCIQSLRIQDKRQFASNGDYHTPSDVKDEKLYDDSMKEIQRIYERLLDRGEKIQVARGVLPLNVCSPITAEFNLRALRDVINTRHCNLVQGEFRAVVKAMKKEVLQKMGESFAPLFGRPCDFTGYCVHADGCGLVEPRKKGLMTSALKDFINRRIS